MNRGALIAFGRRQPTEQDGALPLGSPRLAGTGRILVVEGDQEWLAGSWSVVYEAKYADLMTAAPHMLCATAVSLKTLTLSQAEAAASAGLSARLFWSATASKYLLVGTGSSNAAPASEYAVGATIGTLAESTYPSTSNGVVGAAQFGDGSVVVLHGGTTTNQATRFPGATFTPVSIQPVPVVNAFFIAANGANGVACGSEISTHVNGTATTSDNGATWTNRTGTGTAMPAGNTAGLAWCPCGSVWLRFGCSDGFFLVGQVLSSPDGYTHTERYNSTGWTPTSGSTKLRQGHRSASSSTVTLLAGENRTLLRTTDGVTFTPIQPEVLAGYQLAANNDATFALAVVRDPASGYFYTFRPDHTHIGALDVDGKVAVQILRSTDGLDWEPCIGLTPAVTAVKLRGLEFPNGLAIAPISETTDQITGLLDVSAVLSRTPSTVRAPADVPAAGFNAQWRIK